jgi:hypothetical protein
MSCKYAGCVPSFSIAMGYWYIHRYRYLPLEYCQKRYHAYLSNNNLYKDCDNIMLLILTIQLLGILQCSYYYLTLIENNVIMISQTYIVQSSEVIQNVFTFHSFMTYIHNQVKECCKFVSKYPPREVWTMLVYDGFILHVYLNQFANMVAWSIFSVKIPTQI